MSWRILLLGEESAEKRILRKQIQKHFPQAEIYQERYEGSLVEQLSRDQFDLVIIGAGIRWPHVETLLREMSHDRSVVPLPVIIYGSTEEAGEVTAEDNEQAEREQANGLAHLIHQLLQTGTSGAGQDLDGRIYFRADREGNILEAADQFKALVCPGENDNPMNLKHCFGLSDQQFIEMMRKNTPFVWLDRAGRAYLVQWERPAFSGVAGTEGDLRGWLEPILLAGTPQRQSKEPNSSNLPLDQSLLQDLALGLLVVDARDKVRWANRQLGEIFALAPAHIPGKPVQSILENCPLLNRQEREKLIRTLLHFIHGKYERREIEISFFDGSQKKWRFFSVQRRQINAWEEQSNTLLIFRETTEERNVRLEIEILAHALRSTSECISITDMNNRILFVNDAFLQTYGYRREELIGQHIGKLRPPNFPAELDSTILERTLQGGWEGEVLNQRKDGSVFPTWLTTSAVKDEQGNVIALVGVARDISEQRRQKAALQESQRSLRTLLDKAPEAILLYDVTNRVFLEANPKAEKLLGYSAEELARLSLLDLSPEKQPNGRRSQELIEEYLHRARQGEDPVFEWVHLNKQKQPVYCEVHLTHFISGDRELIRGTILDISRRKKMENELRESEAKFRSFFENSLEIVFTTDARGNLVDVNPAVTTVLGYSPHELKGKSIFDLAVERYEADRVIEALRRKGFIRAQEVRARSKDGAVRIGLISVTILKDEDGRIRGAQGIMHDITERKAQEEEIYRLATVVQQSKEGVVIADAQGKVVYANPAFETAMDQPLGKLLGKSVSGLFGPHSSNRMKEVWAHLKKNKHWEGTIQVLSPDGEEQYHYLIAFPVEDSFGQVINYAFLQRDLTKEKQLEDQLQRAQRLEAIGRLAGGIAHDFNNILSIILGYAELLQGSVKEHPELAADVEKIIEATENGARLTDQLLAFGRRQIMQPRILNLNQVIQEMRDMLRRLLEDTITLEFQLEESLPTICADEGQLQQVLLNLVINARDAILAASNVERPAHIVIRTRRVHLAHPKRFFPEVLPAGNYVRLEVEDTGVGIPRAMQTRIFDPFYTTKPKGKGTGLGLSTVFGIVKQNKGGIELKSTVGQGTCFAILWPVSKQKEKSVEKETEQETSQTRASSEVKPTILYVEDDPEVRELTAMGLQQSGYRVLVAQDGQDALERFGQESIDILFTDVLMPRMDGPQLAAQLKKTNPRLRVLFVSGFAPSMFTEDGLVEDGLNLIRKPYSISQVLERIEQLLEES